MDIAATLGPSFILAVMGAGRLGITQLLRGDGVTAEQLGFCLAGSLAAAAIAVLVTVQLYRSERLAISV